MLRSVGLSLILVCSALLGGCASMSSAGLTNQNKNDGIVYYMPMKSFVLTLVVGDAAGGTSDDISSVVLSTTDAYADPSKAYVLRYGRSVINKIDMTVGVNTSGLLTSNSKATVTSGVSDVAKSLGEFAGSRGARLSIAQSQPKKCAKGTHVFVILDEDDPKGKGYCGLSLEITRIPTMTAFADPALRAAASPLVPPPAEDAPGIYYRQAEPYLLKVTGAVNAQKVLLSPSKAPVFRMPVERTFFANGEVEYEFTDGMPTKFRQSADGELAALIKLPAQFIQAYAAAVGALFESFKTARTNETAAINAQIALELAKQKAQACNAAIKDKDDDAIARLECGK